GVSPSVALSSFNNNSTRYAANLQTAQTPDSVITLLLGRETIFRNGQRGGWFSSGGYGFTVDKSIGYEYLRNLDGVDVAYVLAREYELEVATNCIHCHVHMQSLVDPKMLNVKP
ncbi:MAG: sarcosine dehydrogenase, partial [Yoonia sp.]